MKKALKVKAKNCCSKENERLMRRLESCEKQSSTSEERHACYRRAAKTGGRRARECIAR